MARAGLPAAEPSIRTVLVAYTKAISKAGRSWPKSFQLLNELREVSLQPNVITYTAVLGTCGQAIQWEQVLDVFFVIQSQHVQPTVITCNSSISACDKAIRWQPALALLDAAKRNCQPDAFTYSSAMSSCGRCQHWAKSLDLLGEVVLKLEADVVVLGSAMAAEWSRNLELLNEIPTRAVSLGCWQTASQERSCDLVHCIL